MKTFPPVFVKASIRWNQNTILPFSVFLLDEFSTTKVVQKKKYINSKYTPEI